MWLYVHFGIVYISYLFYCTFLVYCYIHYSYTFLFIPHCSIHFSLYCYIHSCYTVIVIPLILFWSFLLYCSSFLFILFYYLFLLYCFTNNSSCSSCLTIHSSLYCSTIYSSYTVLLLLIPCVLSYYYSFLLYCSTIHSSYSVLQFISLVLSYY